MNPVCRQLVGVTNLIGFNKHHLKQIINKNVILVFGNKGSGKSTLANAFIKGVRNIKHESGIFDIYQAIQYQNMIMFQINHLNKRRQELVEYAPVDGSNDTFLVEYPYPNHLRFANKFSHL